MSISFVEGSLPTGVFNTMMGASLLKGYTLPTGQPGANSSGGLLALPLAFRILLLTTGALVVLSMGLSQVVHEQGGHPAPKWARRYGSAAEFAAAAVAIIFSLAAAIFTIVADLEPSFGAILLVILAVFPEIISIRALATLGKQRAWVWVIRSGSHMLRRVAMVLITLDLMVMSAAITHAVLSG